MDRRVTTQDITWFLDLNKAGQLDLDPPYQRRSVWTAKDRRFFLDTIFRNYPSPAIFLHKDISEDGSVKYRVVDGKQRLQTILSFSSNKIAIAPTYGDVRLDGKRWKDISAELDLKHLFWNYELTVEMIDVRDGGLVNAVFDRLNRNSRKLTPQELRHAKYDGWFISKAEKETELPVWRTLGVASRARIKRMMDVQFMSELMAVIVLGRSSGFDQLGLDELYAEYDDLGERADFSEDVFSTQLDRAKDILAAMEAHNHAVTKWAKGFGPFYTLWSVVALSKGPTNAAGLADDYDAFMEKVEELAKLPLGQAAPEGHDYLIAAQYRENSRGASTEEPQRLGRHNALKQALHL